MAATHNVIQNWFDRGVEQGATHMIVACDDFDHEDYPVYVKPEQDVAAEEARLRESSMQRVMEVYNLSMDRDQQLAQHRAFNY